MLRENLGDRQDSESEADLQDEERDVHQVQTCALMSPANPRYVGRGDDSSGGEVTYTMQEMRTLLAIFADNRPCTVCTVLPP